MNKIQPARFSVITVCYEAGATIRSSLDSLRKQICHDYEFLVIDGGSSDATLSILDDYKDIVNTIVSETDKGIYDAMNKGIARASGEYVYFLNADDQFCDSDVIKDMADYLEQHPEVDLLYGNVIYRDDHGQTRREFNWVTRRNLLYGDLCHQAVFARRALFESIGAFNLKFKINADFDWLLRVFRSGVSIRYIDRDIAVFYAGGRHAKSPELLSKERRTVQAQYVGRLRFIIGNTLFRVGRKLRLLRSLFHKARQK